MREHADFLEELSRLRDALTTGTLEEVAVGYRAFAKSVAEHECREERLVASLADVFDPIR
jgi:hypothetical protein